MKQNMFSPAMWWKYFVFRHISFIMHASALSQAAGSPVGVRGFHFCPLSLWRGGGGAGGVGWVVTSHQGPRRWQRRTVESLAKQWSACCQTWSPNPPSHHPDPHSYTDHRHATPTTANDAWAAFPCNMWSSSQLIENLNWNPQKPKWQTNPQPSYREVTLTQRSSATLEPKGLPTGSVHRATPLCNESLGTCSVFFFFFKWSPNQTNRIQTQPCWTFQNDRFALSPAQQDFQHPKDPFVFLVSYYYAFLMTVKLWSKLNIPVGFYFPSFHPACCSLLPLDWLSRSMVWLEFPHCGAVGETLIFPVSWLSRVFVKGQREWWQLQEGRLLISGLDNSGRAALNTIKYFNKCTVQQNN